MTTAFRPKTMAHGNPLLGSGDLDFRTTVRLVPFVTSREVACMKRTRKLCVRDQAKLREAVEAKGYDTTDAEYFHPGDYAMPQSADTGKRGRNEYPDTDAQYGSSYAYLAVSAGWTPRNTPHRSLTKRANNNQNKNKYSLYALTRGPWKVSVVRLNRDGQ